jgi:hypothetical protein
MLSTLDAVTSQPKRRSRDVTWDVPGVGTFVVTRRAGAWMSCGRHVLREGVVLDQCLKPIDGPHPCR